MAQKANEGATVKASAARAIAGTVEGLLTGKITLNTARLILNTAATLLNDGARKGGIAGFVAAGVAVAALTAIMIGLTATINANT